MDEEPEPLVLLRSKVQAPMFRATESIESTAQEPIGTKARIQSRARIEPWGRDPIVPRVRALARIVC
jgi:hypothetical protein